MKTKPVFLINNRFKFIILIVLSLFILNAAILTGSVRIGYFDTFLVIFNKLSGKSADLPDTTINIIWSVRLPRVLLAFFSGSSLAVAGTVVQSSLKNPLASPYTMGVSSAASFAVGLFIVLGITVPSLGVFFLPLVGFAAGMAAIFVVLVIAHKLDRSMTSTTLVLIGMVFSLFCNAAQTIVVALSGEDTKRIVLWQMGSLAMRGWPFVYAVVPFALIAIAITSFFTKELDVLTLGDEQAKSIGVDTKRIIKILLVLSAVLTGSTVAVCGTIGFIDLVTPHLARRFFGSRHIWVVPSSALIGGSMLVLSDMFARTLAAPSEIPVGAVTALIGAPFFAYIYFKKR